MYREALLGGIDSENLSYISSMEEDEEIAGEVIELLLVHLEELERAELIPGEKAERIRAELKSLLSNPAPLFEIPAEDVHEAIELYLQKKLGKNEGYLPLGKSRNDHVAAALRLKTKRLLREQLRELLKARFMLVEKAEEYKDVIMPAFTHLQPAQPSTFSHYLLAIEEGLADYTEAMTAILNLVDKSPLGAGAVGGTSVPLNRESLRGPFSGVVVNSIYATSSRDFLAMACSLDASLAVFLSRIAEDAVVFTTPNFDYLELPNEHLATSSMMPQKRNPATMEITRAWGGEAIGHLTALLSILKGLPTGYNLDMQEANKHAFAILKGTLRALKTFRDLFSKLEPKGEKLERDAMLFPILATDIAEKVAISTGRPYREVYSEVATLVRESESVEEFYAKAAEKFGIEVHLAEGIKKPVLGSPNPEKIKEVIALAKERLVRDSKAMG